MWTNLEFTVPTPAITTAPTATKHRWPGHKENPQFHEDRSTFPGQARQQSLSNVLKAEKWFSGSGQHTANAALRV